LNIIACIIYASLTHTLGYEIHTWYSFCILSILDLLKASYE
jgi:hypothetical protein